LTGHLVLTFASDTSFAPSSFDNQMVLLIVSRWSLPLILAGPYLLFPFQPPFSYLLSSRPLEYSARLQPSCQFSRYQCFGIHASFS
jgi:hypothetical protein